MIGQIFFQSFLFKKKTNHQGKKKTCKEVQLLNKLNQLKMIVYGDYGEAFVEVL
jgi:hypothetical protein